jgi:alcohol dehydrogenase
VLSSHFVAAENVEDPAQVLIGLTSSADAAPVLTDWPDGTLAEYALMPAEAVTPAEDLDELDASQLVTIGRCIIAFGGLLRGRLSAAETLVVNGATGAYGTAAVLVGAAMGAARVIAAGRNRNALEAVARAGGPRVSTVTLTGDVRKDAGALREASSGGAHTAFDMVGQTRDPNSTLAALHSLRRGGRPVLMGSMTTDLPLPCTDVMLNSWEIIGQFMYPASAYRRLLDLLRSGQLDIRAIRLRVYPLAALPEAMEAAATAGNLECIVMQP